MLKTLSITTICRRLLKQHGKVKLNRRLPPLDELVATILSQNTSDTNSHAAFDELKRRFPDWDFLRRARTSSIVKAIERGGLANQKAPRIKAVLQEVYRREGRLSLDRLRKMPTDQAIQYLRSFSGVGPKTVACVLLFACDKPVLPVDTHVHRVSQRLGLIDPRTRAERAHEELSKLVPVKRVLEFHILLVRHGRRVCWARNPQCKQCVLVDGCPHGQSRLKDALVQPE